MLCVNIEAQNDEVNTRFKIKENTNSIELGQWDGSRNRIESVGRKLFLTSYTGGISFGNSGTEQIVINSAGYFGIGTTTPQTPLDVKGIIKSTDGVGNTLFLGAGSTGSYIRAFGSQNFSLRNTGGTSKISFNVNSGGGLFTGKTIVENSSFRNHIQLKRLENSFNNTWDITLSGGGSTNSLTFTAEDSQGIDFTTRFHISALKSIYGQNDNEWDLGKQSNRFKKLFVNEIDAAGNLNVGGDLSIEKANPNIVLIDNRALDNGAWDNVSLGSFQWKTLDATAPGARVGAEIEAFSGVHAASAPEFGLRFKTSTNLESIATTKYEISSKGDHDFKVGNAIFGGNVGIGTINPSSKLTIEGDFKSVSNKSGWAGWFENKGAGTTNSGLVVTAGEDSGDHILLLRKQNGTETLTVRGNGYVGIGTTTPSEKLEVNGKGKFSSSGTHSIDIDGYEGIKTSGNAHWLHLNRYKDHVAVGYNSTASVFLVNGGGNVGIGTTDTKGFKLGVNGKIATTEVKVATYANWSDFVFYNDYKLPTLKEVETHIKEKGHLKDIPSAAEVKKDGFFLGEMDAKLLQKIEELTLYTIQQEKKIKEQEMKMQKQEVKMKKQDEKIKKQEIELKSLKDLSDRLSKIEARLNTK